MMHLKKYAASFLMLALFLAIGVILWRAAGNLFYLFNFGYIGGAIAFGLALYERKYVHARRVVQLLVGLYNTDKRQFSGTGSGIHHFSRLYRCQ